ncbi:hypothetical protein N9W79_02005 [bacterium]|nr:hypothetical protein [bacterium]
MYRKLSILISGLLFTITNLAFGAGGIDGGGGNAVVCRDNTQKIYSATLLDIYEWQVLEGIEPEPFPEQSYESLALSAAYKVSKGLMDDIDESSGGEGQVVKKLWELFKSKRLINSKLLPNQDSGHFILPQGCEIEPLARYQVRTDKLYINKEIWEALDETNKAALMVHESLYYFNRLFGEQNSDRVRKAVAKAFSGVEFRYYLEDVVGKEVEFCHTVDKKGPMLPWISFVTYKNPTGGVTIQYLSLSGNYMISKATSELPESVWPISERNDNSLFLLPIEGEVDGDQKIFISLDSDPLVHGFVELYHGVAQPPGLKISCIKRKFELYD